MLYDFKCSKCDHEQGVVFSIHDYDKKVAEGGRLKRTRCENCKSISLYRHMIVAPNTLGGPGGYISMERYQRQHPENTSRLKRNADKKMAEQYRKKTLDQINKDMGSGKREDRHKDYGDGQRESKLSSDN